MVEQFNYLRSVAWLGGLYRGIGHLGIDYVIKIYNINNNKKVKVIVIFKGKLKLTKGLLIYLIVIIVLYKVFNCLNFNFIAHLLKNPK